MPSCGGVASAASTVAVHTAFGLWCPDDGGGAVNGAVGGTMDGAMDGAVAERLAAAEEEEPVDVAEAEAATVVEGLAAVAEPADGGDAAVAEPADGGDAAVAERLAAAEGLTAAERADGGEVAAARAEHGRGGDGVSCCSALKRLPPNEAGSVGGRAAAQSAGEARNFRMVPPGVDVVEVRCWAAAGAAGWVVVVEVRRWAAAGAAGWVVTSAFSAAAIAASQLQSVVRAAVGARALGEVGVRGGD